MKISGKIYYMPKNKFDDINTDEILSGPFMRIPEEQLPEHAFEGIIPNFKEQIRNKGILIAGKNFGCGSSREQAPKALIGCGIKAIIAESFGYIFYRNSINLGLALIKADKKVINRLETAAEVSLDLVSGSLKADDTQKYNVAPLEDVSIKILQYGGLLQYLKENDTF